MGESSFVKAGCEVPVSFCAESVHLFDQPQDGHIVIFSSNCDLQFDEGKNIQVGNRQNV